MVNFKKEVSWCSDLVNVPGISLRLYHTETAFQIYCADWLRKQAELFPAESWLWTFWHHSANERLGGMAGFIAKMLGQSKGYPDLVQHRAKLALELKVEDRPASAEQISWLREFNDLGYFTEIVYNFERFAEIVNVCRDAGTR